LYFLKIFLQSVDIVYLIQYTYNINNERRQAMNNREMKAKVFKLANRMAGRMGRRAAFIQAWAIVKAGKIELAVKGVTFGNRQEALRRLAAYRPAQIKTVFVPEPNNPADPAALAVMVGIQGGRGLYRLGYVPCNQTAVVTVIGGKLPALRVVSSAWGWSGKTTFGADRPCYIKQRGKDNGCKNYRYVGRLAKITG
jgi:hypothetical protein